MKKSFLLGAAALAAIAMAPTADAGEVAFGGYYRFQVLSEDTNQIDETNGQDDYRAMRHRLQLKMDMKVSPKTHAHMVMRPVDNDTVEGMGSSFMESAVGTNAVSGRVDTAHNGSGTGTADEDGLDIRQLWLETEAWGVGVKVGEMPMALNDKILLHDDGDSSYGGIVLSKTFSNKITGLLGTIRAQENSTSGRSSGDSAGTKYGADEDDLDIYFLSLLGPFNGINYNATLAYANGGDDTTVGAATLRTAGVTKDGEGDTDNVWAALTLNGKVNGVNWVGTMVYERGFDNIIENSGDAHLDQLDGGGLMVAMRLDGKVSWGEWNAYGFYGTKDFDSMSNRPNWSMLYDSHGTDLLHNFLLGTDSSSTGGHLVGAPHANDSGENSWGLGVGLKFKAGIWTVQPQLDYVAVNDDDYNTGTVSQLSSMHDAWGGTLKASTDIDKATTLSLVGAYVDVNGNNTVLTNVEDNMYTLLAEVRMNF